MTKTISGQEQIFYSRAYILTSSSSITQNKSFVCHIAHSIMLYSYYSWISPFDSWIF